MNTDTDANYMRNLTSALQPCRRNRINMTSILTVILSLTAAVGTCQQTFGQMTDYTVSELSAGGVPSRLNNLGDVAGKADDSSSGETQASIWHHGKYKFRPKHLGKFHGGEHSSASSINDAGDVAGEANTAESLVPVVRAR